MKKTKVVAAIDNTAAGRAVLSAAAAIARILAGRVEAIHVREADPAASTAAAAAAAERMPLSLREGPTVGALTAAAEGEDVRALVLGMHAGRAGLDPVGPTAREVIAAVRNPVVMVPARSPLPIQVRSMLIPLDGDPLTSEALAPTIKWAGEGQLDLHLLHVHEAGALPFFDDQPHHEASAWRQEFRQRHFPDAGDLLVQVRTGVPGDVILAVARELQAGMIALGWSQELLPDRAPVVRSVLAGSPVPILLVAASAREGEPIPAAPAVRAARP